MCYICEPDSWYISVAVLLWIQEISGNWKSDFIDIIVKKKKKLLLYLVL